MANASCLNIYGLKVHQHALTVMFNLTTGLGQIPEGTSVRMSNVIKYAPTWRPC